MPIGLLLDPRPCLPPYLNWMKHLHLLPASLILCGVGFAQSGDDCSAPVTALDGANAFDTTANTDSFYHDGSCVGRDGFTDIWFVYTATASGVYTFDTCGADHDTVLRVFDGAACGGVCLAGNDDACATSVGNNFASRVNPTLTVGQSYLVQIEGWGAGDIGTGTLTITQPAPPATNDDCSSATAISGAGTWAFDTTAAATTTGFNGASSFCYSDINQDLFWEWTATAAGDYQFDTVGSAFDTKMNLHAGAGCAAQCIEGNDDGGGNLTSKIQVTGVNAGDVFLIQVGGFGTSVGSGSLNVSTFVDPCATNPPDQFAGNHSCATAAPIGDGVYSLNVCKNEPDFFALTVPAGGTVDINVVFATATADVDAMLYEAGFCDDDQGSGCNGTLACGFTGSDNETLQYTNTGATDLDCVLRVHVWPNSGGEVNTYDLDIVGAGISGPSLFCDPANTNSTGNSVTLANSDFSGSGVYHIEAVGGPLDQFGMVIVSATAIDPGIPVSQGNLCLGAPIGRYGATAGPGLNSIGRFDAAGVLQNLFGTSTTGTGFDVPAVLPSPPGGVIATGATWHFQLWYRDGSASNFSNGISVTF
jgi:hypothetical protein